MLKPLHHGAAESLEILGAESAVTLDANICSHDEAEREREARDGLRRAGLALQADRRAGWASRSVRVHAWTTGHRANGRADGVQPPRSTGPQNPDRVRRRAARVGARGAARSCAGVPAGRSPPSRGEGDPLHLAGCMLYWAEGAKGAQPIKFSNSDPHMVRLLPPLSHRRLGVEPDEIIYARSTSTRTTGMTHRRDRALLARAARACRETCRAEAHAEPHAHVEQRPGEEQAAVWGVHAAARTTRRWFSTSTGRSRSTPASTSRDGSTGPSH